MNNFIVSARKYRPSTFNFVVGQDYIVTTLKNAIKNNQLAQAFLFCGPRGVGKTTCARILAKTINCTNLTSEFEACNECESCKSFNESASFNIHELDAASNNSVEDIRSLVEQVRIMPQSGKYKVYIIDEVHMLSTSAFNAFLKTLEEPPAYAKFILATTEKQKIIPTILSRCQIFDFKRISSEDIAKHLSWVAQHENIEAEIEALQAIALKSDGALRDALSIFDQMVSFGGNKIVYRDVIQNLNILDYEYFFKLMYAVHDKDMTSVMLTLNEIYDKGFDGQAILSGFNGHLRTLMICKDEVTHKLLEVPYNVISEYKKQSALFSVSSLIKALDIVNSSEISYRASTNKRFYTELAFLKVLQLIELQDNITPGVIATVKLEESENQKKNFELSKPNTQVSVHQQAQQVVQTSQTTHRKESESVQETILDISVTTDFKTEEQKVPVVQKEQSFEFSELQTAIANFYENLTESKNNLMFLTNAHIEQITETDFTIMVQSEIEKNDFLNSGILSYLKTELKNRLLSIEPVLDKNRQIQKAESKEEKLKKLLQEDKTLQRFISELQLHPEII